MTKAPPEVAWRVFSNWERWMEFSDAYEEIRWTRGEPWRVGSRLTIRVSKPVKTTLDHVIIKCVPGECVAWIDHALGTAMEQWVYFNALPEGGTVVRTWAELTGWMPMLAGRAMKDVLLDFTRTWYQRYAEACDHAPAHETRRGAMMPAR